MSAGFIQLAAIGQQDAYLTGSPQVTYFLGVYRRHTPFVLEAYDIPFLDQQIKYGQNHICRIPKKGDLVRGLTLKVTLPALKAAGTDWYWPIQPSFSNAATLYVNGNLGSPVIGTFSGLDFYSTYNATAWLSGVGAAGVFVPYVSYNKPTNTMTFKGASNVWVRTESNGTNSGIFWGLDPRNADLTVTASGNTYLIYNISGSRPADFTLEQAGWLRNPGTGMPDPPSRSGLFLQLNRSLPVPSSGFIQLSPLSGTTYWTNWDSTSNFSITNGGRIKFNQTGLYVMRVGIGMDAGSVATVSWGASSTEDGPPPGTPNFTYSYPWRVSPNPSSPAVFPMYITDLTKTVYVYISTTGTNILANSYIAVNQASDFFSATSGIMLQLPDTKVTWGSNVLSTYSAYTSFGSSKEFTINNTGPAMITGTLYLQSNYVSNVSLWESSNLVYTYDMSSQGRDPTFAFSIPVNVTDTARLYSINVATSNTLSTAVSIPDVTPVGAGTSGAWSVTGTYGTYTMNASTETMGSFAWQAFTPSDFWRAQTNLYSTVAPYWYVGPTYVTRDNTSPVPVLYYGEWIQLVAPVAVSVQSVTITALSPDTAPGECIIFGNSVEGNDGWTVLKSNTALSGTTDTLTITGAPFFRWLRVVFNKAYNGTNTTKPAVRVGVTAVGPNFLLANSYVIFNQIGVQTSDVPSIVLPYNGLLMTPSTTTLKSPLRITTDFNVYGNMFAMSNVTTSNSLQFSNVGTYMVTGALCTADQVTSVQVVDSGGPVYNFPVSLAMRPPFTFSLPFHVTNTQNTFTLSLTTSSVTAAPNLFSNTFLAITPLAMNVTSAASYTYYDSVGTIAIDTAELRIGGQLIQSLTGEYIELWNDLHVPYENQPALKLLTGKYDTTQILAARTYYVNLPFYFFGHPELSVPLVSLDRQDLEVHVKFTPFSNLTAVSGITNPTLDATIITEYVYLSEPEINWFRNNRVEQVITQSQYQLFNLPANFTTGVFSLDLKNPVREMFFIIQPKGNLPYDYSGNQFQSIGLSFNGEEAIIPTTTDHIYIGSLEPFNHYVNFPTRDFYMYSFCTKPTSSKPSGYINMSRIKQILLTLNTGTWSQPREFRVLSVSHNVLRFEDGLAGLMFN